MRNLAHFVLFFAENKSCCTKRKILFYPRKSRKLTNLLVSVSKLSSVEVVSNLNPHQLGVIIVEEQS